MKVPWPAAAPGALASPDGSAHARPFVCETLSSKSLHFSISAIQSRMQLQHADALDLEYTRLMMGFLLFDPAPAQIAMIGLGGGSLVKFCHRHLVRSALTVAEINPHVVALRDSFQVPADDARLRVIIGDGAHLVRDSRTRYDVLLVDGFDTEGLPKALRSQRFYDDCADVLQTTGVLVANLHRDHLHCDTYVERIRRAFAGSTLLVDDSDGSNRVVFAWKGPLVRPHASRTIARRAGLSASAGEALLPAFSRIRSALNQQLASVVHAA